ncbi:MAG: SGNH/GDSL hydrolase family protein [Phycisphaerae bacterium]|nr:SGNH/GDSL hydrolase family protein [Phycisphaerae bacterium]
MNAVLQTVARPGRVGRFLSRSAVLSGLVFIAVAYPGLAAAAREAGSAKLSVFQLAYVLLLVAGVCLTARAPRVVSALVTVIRLRPIRFGFLWFNLVAASLLILFVGRFWGVIVLMLLGSVMGVVYALVPESKRLRWTDETVCLSPMSFAVVYLTLGAGELYLRYHPIAVGGGGGGNPALRALYAGLYEFNELGLRDVETPVHRPDGTCRILAIGDSLTFGQGVPLESTYPKQLEALLNASSEGSKVEVVNAGKTGASTTTELAFLRDEGLSLEPNLITVQFYLNDVTAEHKAGGAGRSFDHLRSAINRSYVLFFLRDRCSALRGSSADWSSTYVKLVVNNTSAWQACARALDGLGEVSRSTGIPVVVILFPHPGAPPGTGKIVYEAVAERSRLAGLPVIDLTRAFGEIDPADQVVSKIDHHPSARVHQRAAVEIASALSQADLLKGLGRHGGEVRLGGV